MTRCPLPQCLFVCLVARNRKVISCYKYLEVIVLLVCVVKGCKKCTTAQWGAQLVKDNCNKEPIQYIYQKGGHWRNTPFFDFSFFFLSRWIVCAVYSAQQQINIYTNRQRRVARVSLNNIYNLKIMYCSLFNYLFFFFFLNNISHFLKFL